MKLALTGKRFGATTLLAALLFTGSTAFAQKFPANPVVKNIIQPVRLNRDTTRLFLTDYFVEPSLIDSISVPSSFKKIWSKKENNLTLIATSEVKPLDDLQLWSKGYAYSIILKKSAKALYTFTYDPKGKEYQQVQLAGELNDWNPKRSPFQLKGSKWELQIELNPGTYQYQVVVDGKWMLDPANPDSADNNNGGFNSIFKAGRDEIVKPELQTTAISATGFSFICRSPKTIPTVKVYWQNFALDKNNIQKLGDTYGIIIPIEAQKLKRSFIRILASDNSFLSNDLLIPLQYGKVVQNAADITRNDKEADRMYFVLVDRFKDGDTSINKKVVHPEIKEKANYYGGDLKGIEDKINDGYIQSLNMNTLWVSPIVENPETAFKEFPEPRDWYSGYHGYWPISLNTIDHRFGSNQDFTQLVQKAHASNMNVMIDLVANHVHEDYPLIKKHPEWKTTLDLPDGRKNIRLWDEYRLTTWFDDFLPTLDFSKPEVVKLEVDSSAYWISQFGIDGFRHDATKHIPESFWRSLTLYLKKEFEIKQNKTLYQLGETYGSKELIGSYIGSGMMDGQFDFNLYFDARAAFAKDDVGFEKLASTLQESLTWYGYHHLMGNISGNHDLPRFTSLAGGALSFSEDARKAGWEREVGVGSDTAYDKMGCMMAFIATIPGVPVVYYGDEIGMPGAGDPDNRRMMKFSGLTVKETELKNKVSRLFDLRANSMSLIYGDFTWVKREKNIMAYKRSYFDETSLVVMNNSTTPEVIKLENINGNLQKLKAQFGNKFVVEGNTINVKIPAKSFEIFTITKK